MRLSIGPAPPDGAMAWIESTRQVVEAFRGSAGAIDTLTPEALDGIDACLQEWARVTPRNGDAFRWQAEVDADEVEYLTNALHNLDQVSDLGQRLPGPSDGRAFYLVVVGALLRALAQECPSRAAFSEQLRQSWPMAAGLA